MIPSQAAEGVGEEQIHRMCAYLRETCHKCPREIDTAYGRGEQGCHAIACETLLKARDILRLSTQNTEGWRPIESAPRDGSWVDVWVVPRNGCKPGRFTDAHWDHGAWREPSFMSNETPGAEIDCDVTHWRPLPAPPTLVSRDVP